MNALRSVFVMVAAFSLALGCSPSPEKVCKHVIELESKDSKGEEMSEKDREKAVEKCVSKVTEKKEKEPEMWKCVAPCAMDAKDRDELRKCDKKCKKD